MVKGDVKGYCMKCKCMQPMVNGEKVKMKGKGDRYSLKGKCKICNCKTSRILSKQDAQECTDAAGN